MRRLFFLLFLLPLLSAQSFNASIVRADTHAVLPSLSYDPGSTSYKDNSITNPDAELRICNLSSQSIQGKFVELVYASGPDGAYIPLEPFPKQAGAPDSTGCAYVPLDINSFRAWYPSIPYVFISNSSNLNNAERVKLTNTTGWFAGHYSVSSNESGGNVTVLVSGATDQGGSAITPAVEFLVIALLGANDTVYDSTITSPGTPVTMVANGTYAIFVNGIGPEAPPSPPPYVPPGGEPGPTPSEISLSFRRIACPSNTVIISVSSGEGTSIRLLMIDPYNGLVKEKTADPDSTAAFPLDTDATYQAIGTKTGYSQGSVTFDFSACQPEHPPPPPGNETNVTPPIPPGGEGGKQNVSENCTSDADCLPTLYCASNGKCEPVKGKCGFAANHTWVSYECCEDKDCAKGEVCTGHVCMMVSYALTGKPTGFVGDNNTIVVSSNGANLAGATLRVTSPDGKTSLIYAGSDGRAGVLLQQEGAYKVDLLVNGTSVKTFLITSLKAAPPSEPVEKAVFDTIARNGSWLLVIVVLAVGAFIYYRYFFTERYKKGKK